MAWSRCCVAVFGARFVAVPADEQGWSGPVMDRLAATGAFLAPKAFANLALYERRPVGACRLFLDSTAS